MNIPHAFRHIMSGILLLGFYYANAATFPAKPSSAHFYVDEADLIATDTGKAIDARASALLTEEAIPMFVVTIPSLASHEAHTYTIEQYATALFKEWGIGSQNRNFGILLLVSLRDRKARIELGAGWGRDYD